MPRPRAACVLLATLLPLAVHAETLTVSAAASLTQAFTEVARRFEMQEPGTTVRLNFAASGTLLQQLRQGAPVDVFASADQDTMDRAAAEQLIDPASRRDFARNDLVLVVPAQGGAAMEALQALAGDAVRRIAIGRTATVPAGRYTQQALESAGLWTTLQPKFVQAASVRQVLDYVARGETDAGFVYRTDAALMPDAVRIALTVGGHEPVSYPVAAVAGSSRPELARRFVDFLQGGAARPVLARYGFGQP
ncbi:molybdate ABC transporter substrate-binding protein [Bordetella sp. 2513F-2]